MNVDTKAIVIKKHKVSGADVILTIYSKELGKKRLYVKGARHPKNRFLACSQVLIEGEFSLYVKPSLSSINSVSITNSHNIIKEDLNKFFVASYVLELIDKITEEACQDVNLYEFLSFALKCLEAEKEENLKFFRLVFIIKLLQASGLSPEVNFCTSCLSNQRLSYFSSVSGGIVCEQCKDSYPDIKVLKKENADLINLSLNDSYINIRKNKKSDYNLLELSDILDDFLMKHILNSDLKTASLIKNSSL